MSKTVFQLCSFFAILALILIAATGCQKEIRTRPFGMLRLGTLTELEGAERFLDRQGILLRRDERGFSAMSTHCTFDLSALTPKEINGEQIWVSNFSESTYHWDGTVRTGPARGALPYFELRLQSWEPNGRPDTLSVVISREVGPDWRLPLPGSSGDH